MSDKKRQGFTVIENDEEALEDKIRAHRLRIAKIVILLMIIIVSVGTGIWMWLKFRTYVGYEVKEEISTGTVSEAEYYDYGGALLKVSKNGAIYTTVSGELIWNQAYEMNTPMVDICDNFVAIGAKKGNEIYILNKEGLKGKIETTRQIRAIEVAGQGTVAVLTEKNHSYFINLYDYSGVELVQGEMHLENSGYPLAMSLSSDGILLAVSLVDVSTGQADAQVRFYNFGTVGQNEIDNMVSSYDYEDKVIPRIVFLGDSRAVAFSEDTLYFYHGTQKPEQVKEITIAQEIRSVFYSDKYVGITYNDKEGSQASADASEDRLIHTVVIYDAKGNQVMSEQYDKDYEKAQILNNEEVVLTRDKSCLIYGINAGKRFEGEFQDMILKVSQALAGNEYYILYKEKTQRIKLN